jgi:glycosyltransferase involved in cell wall biosynthesis/spore maturation protein CgeB
MKRHRHGKLNVILLNTKHFNPNYYIVLGIEAALRSHAAIGQVARVEYKDLVATASEGSYDLLLAVDGENIVTELIVAVRTHVKWAVLWTFDDPYERKTTTQIAELFDLIFTNDEGSVDHYPNGTTHLPLAASPALDERAVRASDTDYLYDVSFIGSAWPNRVSTLRALQRRLPHLKWRIVLSYSEHLPRLPLNMPDSSYVGSVSHFDFVEIANRSRINLTLHREFSGDGELARAVTPGPRIFELALAGSFQLVDTANMNIAPYYVTGREIDTFHDVDCCAEKIHLYLKLAHRRIEMATAAHAATRSRHLYEHRVSDIIAKLPSLPSARVIQQPISATEKPRLLFVTHNTLSGGNFGGVEVYQETVASAVRSKYDIFYHYMDAKASNSAVRWYSVADAAHRVISRYSTPAFDWRESLSNPVAERAFARTLFENRIDIIHYHHLINHIVSLPIISDILGIPSVYTLQDFYLTCARFNLLDYQGIYCRIAERPHEICDVCLSAAEGKPAGSQQYRRAFLSRVLRSFKRIMGNSPSAMKIALGVYPELGDRADTFVQIGLPLPRIGGILPDGRSARTETTKPPAPLQVAFFGNFTRVKGAETFLNLAKALAQDNVAFTILGRLDEPYPEILRNLNLGNTRVYGEFEPGQVDLSKYDLSLHLSIWPETYCITLSEAWQAGVIPVVTDVGALGDRVIDEVNGFAVPVGGVGELIRLLRRLEGRRAEIDEMRARLSPALWLTADEHCATLMATYGQLLDRRKRALPVELPKVDTGTGVTVGLIGKILNSPDWSNLVDGYCEPHPPQNWTPMFPLYHVAERAKASVAAGSYHFSSKLEVHIDAFVDAGGALGADAIQRVGRDASIRLVGWLRVLDGVVYGDPVLIARSIDNDILPSKVYLTERTDVAAFDPAGSQSTGFLTEQIDVRRLDARIYVLEIAYVGRERCLFSEPLGFLMRDGYGNVLVVRRGVLGTTVGILMEGAPLRLGRGRRAVQHIGVQEELKVVNMPMAEGNSSLRFSGLVTRGWMLESGSDFQNADVILQMRGPKMYHIPLQSEVRPDLSKTIGIESIFRCGYVGGAWLTGMEPGCYRLDLVRRTAIGDSRCEIEGQLLEISSEHGGAELFSTKKPLRTARPRVRRAIGSD